jgi:hypothetical protein
MGSYVGIDLHRRRSVIVVLNDDGDRVSWSRIDNTPANLAAEIVAAGGPDADVAMEATWGWYWAADVIAECGARLHLAHPLGIAGYENRRVKNDIRDATLLETPICGLLSPCRCASANVDRACRPSPARRPASR